MQAKEFFKQSSVKREINRFKKLGGRIEYSGNKLILYSGPIPKFIAEVFAKRIKALDFYGVIEIIVNEA